MDCNPPGGYLRGYSLFNISRLPRRLFTRYLTGDLGIPIKTGLTGRARMC
jgi:hypothetical protein